MNAGQSQVQLDDILVTAELSRRPPRLPNFAAENQALVSLAQTMAQAPHDLLPCLVDMALALCHAGSAGISLLEDGPDGARFRWVALNGAFAPYVGGTTPRDFSPCGTCLDRAAPQLYAYPARYFTYFAAVDVPITEGLVIPLYGTDGPLGTIWVVAHDEHRHFDAEDVRIMTSLGAFTAAALQVVMALASVKQTTVALATSNAALQAEIIERTRMEEALRASEARFRAIFEGAAIGISLTDMEGRSMERNAALEAMLGYSGEELCHLRFADVTHPDDVQADLDLFNALMAGQRSHYQLEKRFIRKDGRVIWGRLTVSLVRDNDGTPQFAIGMVEDITERKQVVAELTKAQRWLAASREAERTHLARELHDSTIQHLLGVSYLLDPRQWSVSAGQQPDIAGDTRLTTILNSIHAEVLAVVSQLRGLIRELRPAGLEELGLTVALEGYVARLQRERGLAEPELVLDLDQSDPALPTPIALCLFRTAQEALRNALQHAQAHHILLQLRLSPREAVLRVCDDGCGFQMPDQLSELARADHFGLLGMAERVTLAGGRLAIQSQPGAGTEVIVHIPLSAESNPEYSDAHGAGS